MNYWVKRRPKYGNKRTANGFPSKLEEAVYNLLQLFVKGGEIKDLVRQPQVRLTKAGIGYKPDFKYTDCKTGEDVWVEAKGVETEGYLIRKRLWKHYGPGKLEIYKGTYRRPKLVEVIQPGSVYETPNSDDDC